MARFTLGTAGMALEDCPYVVKLEYRISGILLCAGVGGFLELAKLAPNELSV